MAVSEHGTSLTVAAPNARLLARIRNLLLMPTWQAHPWEGESPDYLIRRRRSDFELLEDGQMLSIGPAKQLIPYLVSQFHHRLATHAQDIFVHAGCVEVDGQAILLPGRSYSGKSTLTAALVAAGAGYLSDEYAIFRQETGLIYPFPRTIHLRQEQPSWLSTLTPPTPPSYFDGLPLGAVVKVKFSAEATWDGQACSPGQAALHLFDNTVAAQRLGAEALRIFAATLSGKRHWQGQRGSAEDAAVKLLSWLRE
jgi:hypothetical protein